MAPCIRTTHPPIERSVQHNVRTEHFKYEIFLYSNKRMRLRDNGPKHLDLLTRFSFSLQFFPFSVCQRDDKQTNICEFSD